MARRHITLKTKLAAALCQMLKPMPSGGFVRIIPHDEAKQLTEDEIISRFDMDHHPIPKAYDGPDVHWNLVPTPREEHRAKTASEDVPRIAKSKRLQRAAAEHEAAMAIDPTPEQIEMRRKMLARSPKKQRKAWPKRKMRSQK